MSSGDLISFVLYTDARFVIDLLTYCVKTLVQFFLMLEESFHLFVRWFLWKKNHIDFRDATLVAMLLNRACKQVISTAPKVSLSGSVAMLGSRKPSVDSPSLSMSWLRNHWFFLSVARNTTSTALQHAIPVWLLTKVLCLLFPLPLVQLKRFSRSLIVSLQRDLIGFYVSTLSLGKSLYWNLRHSRTAS